MTPSEHYREAERLFAEALTFDRQRHGGNRMGTVREAQLHATLATAPKDRAEPQQAVVVNGVERPEDALRRVAAEHYEAQARIAELESELDAGREQRNKLYRRIDELTDERDRARDTAAALGAENGRLVSAGRRVVQRYPGVDSGAAVGALSRVVGSSYHTTLAKVAEQVPETEEPRLCGCGRYGDHDESHERR
jgi:hypothetical protein